MAAILTRKCKRKDCRKRFKPKFYWQRYCKPGCGNIDRVRKHRNGKKK